MGCSFLAGATTADHTVLNAAISGGKPYGVFGNPTISIENGTVSVEPMSGLFPSGVFMSQDISTSVTAPTPAAGATNYTLAWKLDPGLATQPALVILVGVYNQGDVTDYIVVGWIYHPGMNLSMSTEMFVQAPRAGAPTSIVEFDADTIYNKLLAANTIDASVAVTRTRDGQVSLVCGSDTQQTLLLPLLIPVRDDVIQSLVLDVQLSSQAWITWERVEYVSGVITTKAIPYAALGGQMNRMVVQVPFARQVQAHWSTVALELTLTLGAGSSANLSRIAATTLPTAVLKQL